MLRTILIDDEAHIRDTLTRLLAQNCPLVTLVGEASGVAEGIRVIQMLHPDLVLLDINLKDGTGFDLLNAFNIIDFKIIFISSFNKEMIREFRLSDIDYLQKPVSPVELSIAVKKTEKTSQRDFVLQLKALCVNIKTMGVY